MTTKTFDRISTGFTEFRTIRVPCVSVPMPAPTNVWAAVRRRLAAKRGAVESRDLLGRLLTEAGHRFQTLLEEEEATGVWRVHFFAGKDALAYLEKIAGWSCGPGDPVGFDPSVFLAGWSRQPP
jgi:hypothetical protein